MKIPDLKRIFLASALCTVFVLGTVILPLTHYGWMILSGRFDHHYALSESHQLPIDEHAGHFMAASNEDPQDSDGSKIVVADIDLLKCDYATTVNITPVVVHDVAYVGDILQPASLQLEPQSIFADTRAQHRLPWFRGPPLV